MLSAARSVSKLFIKAEKYLSACNKGMRANFTSLLHIKPQNLKNINIEGLHLSPALKTDVLEITAKSKSELSLINAQKLAHTNNIDLNKVSQLKIPNLRILNSNSVSGATFECRQAEDLLKLKDTGINTIIDFRSEASLNFAERCKQSGFEYFNIPLEQSYNLFCRGNKTNRQLDITDKFVEKLKHFFKLADEGNAYMGCRFGIDRTNIGLTYNYFLNMNASKPPILLSWGDFNHSTVINRTIKAVKKTIKKLTPEQRKMLDLPENYDEILKKRIYHLRLQNGMISGVNGHI